MEQVEFSININASREKVWNTLWNDETFRQWADIIDPGTHMVGELKEGAEVQFISGNGYGVSSLVSKLTDNKFLELKHRADTKDNGSNGRDDHWTGGKESYSLLSEGELVRLRVAFDVPPELVDYFNENYPKAMECIRRLAEN